ncbi:MAG TPA: aminoglycoside phosphotransferase [Erythrobacter sp.]|nr:aminoglycoside phosphotransferase [Erythrobacter sp.]
MSKLPAGILDFLESAGWGDAKIDPIPGDASFRRYFRLSRGGMDGAMLMHAPPSEEDPVPFLNVAEYLAAHGLRSPQIFAASPAEGWVLLEDFGDDRMRDWLDDNPDGEIAAYEAAVDTLVDLHRRPAGKFPPYDMEAYTREHLLFVEWYCSATGLSVDEAVYHCAWKEVLAPLCERQKPGVTVLRDYHAENIMLLGDPRDGAEQGLIDFQDALVGHPAYDLVSLLQDARRDVSPELEREMLNRYMTATNAGSEFEDDYARLGAQRNAKIVGIFTRLYKRDGKPRYLELIPRVWRALERDLEHPALAPVAKWFDLNIPAELRAGLGGKIK